MFNSLSDRLGSIFSRLRKRGALSEEDVGLAMREIRVALLEADVALGVVKDFTAKVKEKAVGQEVLRSVTPGQMVVKIVHDQLVDALGGETTELNLNAASPVVIMMVGLQGSGKTTSTAKLAHYLTTKLRKKVLMASTDVYRPAARQQLATLGQQTQITTLGIIEDEKPLSIAKRAYDKARLEGFDVLFIDTAGRLHIDEPLMEELSHLKSALKPAEIMLVADAMTGQDAVNVAATFKEKIGLTGVMLTRIDGDARGGAALSMRAITGCPIKYVGVGEQISALEPFHPERIAGRILDMGDVVSLVEKAAETIDQEEAEALAQKMQAGSFDLQDMEKQLLQVKKMGGLTGLLGMMPGVGRLKDKISDAGIDDTLVGRQIAIIRSMTLKERKNVKLLNASRRRRIALGSGTSVEDVNKLLKQYTEMSRVMKQMKKLGKKGLARQGLASLFKR